MRERRGPNMVEVMLGGLSHVVRVLFPGDVNNVATVMERDGNGRYRKGESRKPGLLVPF